MRLRFLKNRKSITYFDDVDLPDFTVLTGVNGAGKSHLLEAIDDGAVSVADFFERVESGRLQLTSRFISCYARFKRRPPEIRGATAEDLTDARAKHVNWWKN